MADDVTRLRALRDEVQRLLAAGLESDARHLDELRRRDEMHLAETERRDELHVAETKRRDELHTAELDRRDRRHTDELASLSAAIDTRDIIGQAKGVIIVTMGCTSDEAFVLLKAQSQHENRKLVEVAMDIVAHAQR